jgi:hypothetical protein
VAISIIPPGRSGIPEFVPVAPAGGASKETSSPPKVEKRSTNAVSVTTPTKPAAENASVSQVGQWIAAVTGELVETGMWWFYTILVFLAAAILVLRKAAWGGSKRAAKPPRRFP